MDTLLGYSSWTLTSFNLSALDQYLVWCTCHDDLVLAHGADALPSSLPSTDVPPTLRSIVLHMPNALISASMSDPQQDEGSPAKHGLCKNKPGYRAENMYGCPMNDRIFDVSVA